MMCSRLTMAALVAKGACSSRSCTPSMEHGAGLIIESAHCESKELQRVTRTPFQTNKIRVHESNTLSGSKTDQIARRIGWRMTERPVVAPHS